MKIWIALHVLVAFSAGTLAGSAVTLQASHPPGHMSVVPDDPSPRAAVVRVFGIRNGALQGVMEGDVRLFAGGPMILAGSGGVFSIDDRKVLTNEIRITVPPGMKYVASKRGKKYYPVASAAAASIVPQNRIYFPDAASARRSGYVP